MRIVFDRLPTHHDTDGFVHVDYPALWLARDVLFECLNSYAAGVYVDMNHSRLNYNDFYHFYDLNLFPLSPRVCLTDFERRFRLVAAAQGWHITLVDPTWYWPKPIEGPRAQVRGLRIWIEAQSSTPVQSDLARSVDTQSPLQQTNNATTKGK